MYFAEDDSDLDDLAESDDEEENEFDDILMKRVGSEAGWSRDNHKDALDTDPDHVLLETASGDEIWVDVIDVDEAVDSHGEGEDSRTRQLSHAPTADTKPRNETRSALEDAADAGELAAAISSAAVSAGLSSVLSPGNEHAKESNKDTSENEKQRNGRRDTYHHLRLFMEDKLDGSFTRSFKFTVNHVMHLYGFEVRNG